VGFSCYGLHTAVCALQHCARLVCVQEACVCTVHRLCALCACAALMLWHVFLPRQGRACPALLVL
jgi:hypothetical protein